MCSWTNSRANSIAPSLKYCPNEKLPSISKNVRWWPSSPTSSMSTVRKHFCDGRRQRRRRWLQAEEERHLRLHPRSRPAASSRRRRAGRASTTGSADGPAPRRTRGSPHAARRSCASRDSTSGVARRPGAATRRAAGPRAPPSAALRSSSSSSLSRRAAASFATRTASPASRRARNAENAVRHAGGEPADLLHRAS